MKICNIRNVKEFAERLVDCEGTIELINENGARIHLLHGKEVAEQLFLFHMAGGIREIDLIFHKNEDFHRILSYLVNHKKIPA